MEAKISNTNDKNNSYFAVIPNEILIKILNLLSTYDVLQFCEAYPTYEYFFGETAITNTINLSKKTGFKSVLSLSSIIKKFRIDCITVFNITYVYWVPAIEIRNCLKKMKNLEELHLIGTKVGLAVADCESFRSLKLKKLAVSVEDISNETQNPRAQYFPNIRSLCVQILSKKSYTFQFRLECIFSGLKDLEELWIYDISDSFPLNYDHLTYSTSNLKILAFKAKCATCATLRYRGLTKVFSNERTGGDVYYEKNFKTTNPRFEAESSAWKVLNELHAASPYGLNDAKKLYSQKKNINDIEFEELNFFHVRHSCCPRYLTAVQEMLLSENSRNLKKLTLTNCLFADESQETSDNPKKKKKYDYKELLSDENKLVNNLKALKELEIFVCPRHGGFKIYYFLQHLKNLTHLSLEIPGALNGEFLKLVFENCALLESLKINVVVSNESFNHDFCRYISSAKNLKTLRYEHYRISLETIFFSLSSLSIPKMERLFLKCTSVDNFGVMNLNKFLKKNDTLNFIMIIISSATADMRKTLTDELKSLKILLKRYS
ncbi:hypothetical protein HHI36_012281 [Cryptolaemus montrouzieri]|uniref:F-box domain-containing protein n=1 Tax=Cryptolaemus montrouzieri TaxID=559131 RepID=A0ABD2NDR7_9CUCU